MPDWTDRNNEDLPNRNRSDPQGSEKSGGTDIWGIVSAGKTSGGNSDSRAARGGGDAVSELLAKKTRGYGGYAFADAHGFRR